MHVCIYIAHHLHTTYFHTHPNLFATLSRIVLGWWDRYLLLFVRWRVGQTGLQFFSANKLFSCVNSEFQSSCPHSAATLAKAQVGQSFFYSWNRKLSILETTWSLLSPEEQGSPPVFPLWTPLQPGFWAQNHEDHCHCWNQSLSLLHPRDSRSPLVLLASIGALKPSLLLTYLSRMLLSRACPASMSPFG